MSRRTTHVSFAKMPADESTFRVYALQIAPDVGRVATYCDKVEHNEQADVASVTDAGQRIRVACVEFAANAGIDLIDAYAERLALIEARNVLGRDDAFDGRAAARGAQTWRDLQLVQVEHDRYYHPDVIGLTKLDQLRHYLLHLAKIVGVFANPTDPDDLVGRRLPDCLLFAIKLQTVTGSRLPQDALPRTEIAPRRDSIVVPA